jgi:hypothetical protein
MPTLTTPAAVTPAATTSPLNAPATSATSAASSVSPLYQQFIASAGQAGQLAQNFPSAQTAPASQQGWIQDILGPELSAVASGARGLQATPDVLEAAGDTIIGNGQGAAAHEQAANTTMASPIGNVKTFKGMNNEELLGAATQTAGQGLMLGGAPAAASFGAQAGGSAMQNDKGPVQVIKQGLIGAIGGKLGEAVAPYAGKALGAAYSAVVPQAAQDIIGGAADAVSGGLQKLSQAISPTLDKLIPDKTTSNILTPLLDKVSPTISKMFTSSAGEAADSSISNVLSANGKAINLRTTLGSELTDMSDTLTQQFPDAKVTLNASQVQAIQNAATKAGISLPKFMDTAATASIAGEDVTSSVGEKIPSIDLTISQAQELGTSLNQAYEKGYVESVYGDLRQTVRDSLNTAQPGLGTVYDQMYETASKGFRALDSLSDIFNTKPGAVTATDLNGSIAKIQNLSSTPQGQKILQMTMDNFKATTGVDLSTETNAVAAAGKIKDPLVRRAANAAIDLLKKNGMLGTAIGAYEVLKHF